MTPIDDVTLNFSPASLMLLNAILAIVVFSVAIDLTLRDFRTLGRAPKPLFVGFAAQFLVLPAVTFALVMVTRPQASIALGLILVAACPGGTISNFFTHRARGNTALSLSMTALATIGAIVLTPLNIAFWGGLYPPSREILRQTAVDPVTVAITVGLMLLLPLVLGITLNTRAPRLADRLRGPLKHVSMGIFVVFILAALAGNWSYFLAYAGPISGLVIAHNALALAGGYALARAAGLTVADRRAVTLETGIQNSGLGLVLIFAFFGGLGGMAIVAALWGIWHVISGFAVAALFVRRDDA
ncbi:bile acid:sodium symporter family protein [Pseudooceanicola aestuarii]|uniref:bile acid:sodium symporter family protein n=1 Tax=Pseudooceanicola aestuarii TaxID=2697319 RepID=UPI0013D4827D|nr:bile acid:sodium symporter family protein [Pseudooceanicola aestuarii]